MEKIPNAKDIVDNCIKYCTKFLDNLESTILQDLKVFGYCEKTKYYIPMPFEKAARIFLKTLEEKGYATELLLFNPEERYFYLLVVPHNFIFSLEEGK